MSEDRSPAFLSREAVARFAVPLTSTVVLAAVLGLMVPVLQSLEGLRTTVESQPPLVNDDEFYRHPRVLGRDFAIFDWIRKNLPAGETISISYGDWYPLRTLRKTTRLWLALLPQYRISDDGRYLICRPKWCDVSPGDVTLVQGQELVLQLLGEE